MQLNDCFLDAVNTVLSWDIPDEACSEAFTNQACLMAGIEPEQICGYDVDATVH